VNEIVKEKLVRQFCSHLDDLPDQIVENLASEESTDLYSLYAELIALKNEVRIESRQVKSAVDEFKSVFETLQSAQEQMAAELEQHRKDKEMLTQAVLRPILLGLLDLYDRLEAGLQAGAAYRPSWLSRWVKRESRMLSALWEGQQMTLNRLQNLLDAYGVRPIAVLDQPFDPVCMRAVETEHRSELPDGIVTAVLRTGYVLDDELLRTPDVRINKSTRK